VCTASDNDYSGIDHPVLEPASEQGAEDPSRLYLLAPSSPPPGIGGDGTVLAPYPAAGWLPTTPPLKREEPACPPKGPNGAAGAVARATIATQSSAVAWAVRRPILL
jgi:hypothetical protein